MQRILMRSLSVIVLVLAFVPLISPAQRRNFAGTYQLSSAKQSEDAMQVTVTLVLRNFSGADIHGGTVILLDSSPAPVLLGKFTSVKLFENTQRVKMSGVFSVPLEEYALWAKGRDPVLRFEFPATGEEASIESIDLQRSNTVNSIAN